MRLLRRHTLTVRRRLDEGYYNDEGRWVSSDDYAEETIKGNLQPYVKGNIKNDMQLVLPNGVRTTDTMILYTTAELVICNDRNWTEADLVMVKGTEYEVYSVMDWTEQLAHTSHYEYLLIRRDKMNELRNNRD
ncbi:hypothetical protein ZYZZX_114 [Hafnia phage vB_HpaM_Zyzzx]|jgi:hypothetical protein|uniref:Uncharacterized protein n=1 Tax=Hafnia phage vB_HpaM_Zyzzx TaxID=2836109 RepID=A0AAE7WCD1_9CAUD|nr:hypothetical protein ZYZZX_114 [Hafnia phage vB_HpaM_Zyzzx]